MADTKIELRLAALEEKVARLEQQATAPSESKKHWIDDVVGAFADDPDFWEAMRLGREYRESLRPKARKRAVK
jgi:hypothetical protein